MMQQEATRQSADGSGAAKGDGGGMAKNIGQAASDAYSKAAGVAQQATDAAKQAAVDTTSSVTHQVRDLLDRQVGTGADMVGHFASSAKLAADDLDKNAPQLAGFVRLFAERVESYSDDLRDQTVDQLLRSGSDFTRRQPALVFGLAALAGFFAFRTLKSSPAIPSPSIQPSHGSGQHAANQSHGA
jgi:hypothetical protein